VNKQQREVANLLSKGLSISKAASQSGLARETVSRWANHNREFQKMIWAERVAGLNDSLENLTALVPAAVKTLEEALNHPKQRLRAAKTILSLSARVNAETVRSQLEKLNLDEPLKDLPEMIARENLSADERDYFDAVMDKVGLSRDYVVNDKENL